MARLMRAFTIDAAVSVALDRLLNDSEALKILLPKPTLKEIIRPFNDGILDDQGLLPENYAILYELSGAKRLEKKLSVRFGRMPYYAEKSDWEMFTAAILAVQNIAKSNYALQVAKDLGKINRLKKQKAEAKALRFLGAPTVHRRSGVNASRVAEALIKIGLETLHSRIESSAPSSSSNAAPSSSSKAPKKERSKQLEFARSTESHDGEGKVERPRRQASKTAAFGTVRRGPRA